MKYDHLRGVPNTQPAYSEKERAEVWMQTLTREERMEAQKRLQTLR